MMKIYPQMCCISWRQHTHTCSCGGGHLGLAASSVTLGRVRSHSHRIGCFWEQTWYKGLLLSRETQGRKEEEAEKRRQRWREDGKTEERATKFKLRQQLQFNWHAVRKFSVLSNWSTQHMHQLHISTTQGILTFPHHPNTSLFTALQCAITPHQHRVLQKAFWKLRLDSSEILPHLIICFSYHSHISIIL